MSLNFHAPVRVPAAAMVVGFAGDSPRVAWFRNSRRGAKSEQHIRAQSLLVFPASGHGDGRTRRVEIQIMTRRAAGLPTTRNPIPSNLRFRLRFRGVRFRAIGDIAQTRRPLYGKEDRQGPSRNRLPDRCPDP